MSVETDKVPPVPEHTPPLREDEVTRENGKFFNQTWTRWLVSLRDKVNVINESVINLIDVIGTGFLVKNGIVWVTRSFQGTSNRVTVTNGDGTTGNPTVDVVTADLVAGTNVSFSGSGTGRIIDNGSGNLTINATGGGGGSATGGITVTGGSLSGSVLNVGTVFSAILPTNYALDADWFLWCAPSGSIELDVWVDNFANVPPVVGDSIVGGNYPTVSSGIAATGDFSGWGTTALTQSQAITIQVRSVTSVKWFTFTMQGTKS